MSPFTYRALDLLADYEASVAPLPSIWRNSIEHTENPYLVQAYDGLLWALLSDALTRLNEELDNEAFSNKLGSPTDRDQAAAKLLLDLGLNTGTCMIVMSYFAGRRNLLDDERCWVRFTGLIDDEISIRAC